MRARRTRLLVWAGALVVALWVLAGGAADGERVGVVLEVQDSIGPATSDYIARALEHAEERGAEVVILRMDTPGGLDTSMRAIIKSITTADVPVVTYVAPSGSRAASAGTYILYASHVAAMAPGTNLGAATPVQLGGLPGGLGDEPEKGKDKQQQDKDGGGQGAEGEGGPQGSGAEESASAPKDAKTRKIVNDAVAYLRSLARLRDRNGDWAEKAVREGASLPAQEALEKGVIDIIAVDMDELKRKLDGREVQLPSGERTLETAAIPLETVEPDWRSELLAIISNPNVAYILMLVGIYGLIYEFANPGAILPGTAGFVSLMLALYAFHVLPVNYAGFALILLGLALMVAEAFAPSFGALGISGAVAFVLGSVILIDTDAPGYGISLPLILGLAAVSAALMFFTVGFALKAWRRPVVSGAEELLGAPGRAVEAFGKEGHVRVHGEVWSARTEAPVESGQYVRVTGRDGLVLQVTPDRDRRD